MGVMLEMVEDERPCCGEVGGVSIEDLGLELDWPGAVLNAVDVVVLVIEVGVIGGVLNARSSGGNGRDADMIPVSTK